MKTLQQEIVDALKIGATRCEDLRDCCDEFSRFTYIYNDESLNLRQLAAKVESARCENCAIRESDVGWCGLLWKHVDPGFGCWHFEQKVESK